MEIVMPPLHILQIDASARPGISGVDPHGSHTRRLTHRFIERWRVARPQDNVTYRDVGQQPPLARQWRLDRGGFHPP
jgi:FMN-dependent NADH-azoreductase